jgi:hypothetical protein
MHSTISYAAFHPLELFLLIKRFLRAGGFPSSPRLAHFFHSSATLPVEYLPEVNLIKQIGAIFSFQFSTRATKRDFYVKFANTKATRKKGGRTMRRKIFKIFADIRVLAERITEEDEVSIRQISFA